MTYVYKALPGGGYTAMPATTPKDVARFVAQGWSETAPVPTAPSIERATSDLRVPVEDAPEAPVAPPRRRRSSVN